MTTEKRGTYQKRKKKKRRENVKRYSNKKRKADIAFRQYGKDRYTNISAHHIRRHV